ncbi:MAG TPA: hypothetical protein VGG25_09145, partial [Streptosporangiaceae bacterium]
MTRPEGSTRTQDPPDVTCPLPELADGAVPEALVPGLLVLAPPVLVLPVPEPPVPVLPVPVPPVVPLPEFLLLSVLWVADWLEACAAGVLCAPG